MNKTLRNFYMPEQGAATVRKVSEEDRTVQFVISDERKDRHGTVIKMDGWQLDDFNNNGIVGYMHEVHGSWDGSNPDQVIGIGKAFREGDELIGEVTFEPADINPLAEKLFKKVQFGSIRATSVGFMPEEGHWGSKRDGEDEDTYYFTKQSLLEFSLVNIPSNANALKRGIGEGVEEYLERNKPEPLKTQDSSLDTEIENPTNKLIEIELGLKKKKLVV